MDAYENVIALETEAQTAHNEGRFEHALLAHSRALEIANTLNRPRLVAALFNQLGWMLESSGSLQDAVIAYESGLEALSADSDLDLEHVLAELGAVSKAYDYRNYPVPDLYSPSKARALVEAEADPALPVRLLINVGNAYLRQPQENAALQNYKQALQRPEILTDPVLRAYTLANVGEIQRRRGEIDEAELALDEAVLLLDAHAGPLEKRRALALLAGIARDRGELERAGQLYEHALTLYSQADDALGAGRTYAGLGRLYLEQKNCPQAEQAYQRALYLADSVGDKDTLWHAHWGLGCCQQAAGRLVEAVLSLRQSLLLIAERQQDLRTDEGKITFLESVQDVFDRLIAIHLEIARTNPKGYSDALAVAEEARGRGLLDLMDGRERHLPRTAATVRPRRLRLQSDSSQSPTQTASGFHISQARETPWVQMAAGVDGGPAIDEDEPVLEETPTTIEPKPLARLVYHVLEQETAIFVVSPEGAVTGHVAPLGREMLASRVARLRTALGVEDPQGVRLARHLLPAVEPGDPVEAEPLLQQLYSDLIAPVLNALPADGTPLVVEPHAALWLAPFAALLDSDGVWLSDRWPLLFSPSAHVLEEIRREPDYGDPSTLKALIFGNPVMPAVPTKDGLEITLMPLPGAESEAQAIAGMFADSSLTLLLGAKADRAAFERLAPEHGILHLATHGVAYADDPLASFVALAEPEDGNGLLTARHVMRMVLPADLVVLSACQTGLGRVSGDGMLGLSRAFLVAGARAVLVSQWSVSDQATAALMKSFYQGYIKLDNKAVALQQAMQTLRSRPEYAHPRFWAPFVVVGAEA